ncbi:MAG: hypothetical protein COW03_15705 [Cytophagales bacterium CG12_big_fil_rev_8_21_14_0_65_40_12]|nr:MAG: hypothetical protein COW03_15705 [Cytophagales bacterium CG12_big_fil_rev_8_21_14_0_65_40_12]PIW04798.1 MAG: hypothetical protein COW40_07985 [Cytophagales bacterium CG17_big_fil_post_rev_8_21_14_2_50_40_13]
MTQIRIIVEGESDRKFLKDYIKHSFEKELSNDDFIIASGNLLSKPANSIQRNTIEGGINITVLDADTDIEGTRNRVSREIQEFDLMIDNQFYIPNDDQPGNLETLLRRIINEERGGILDCIDQYGRCIETHRIAELRKFDEKAKVFVYVDSFAVGGQGKPDQVDYRELLLWNLDSEYLRPLYDFLQPYFSE